VRSFRVFLLPLLVLALAAPGRLPAQTPEAAIKAVLDKQAADWNRGDIDAFAKGYKDSPDILFMGAKIQRGYASMVQHYKQVYSDKAKMGVLSFSNLEVQPLDANFATVTGKFHLGRTAAGGGNADGYFLLVCEKTATGWKIVRDDTSASPKE
jgi:ketosteroid isomerase-like protein